MSARRLAAGFCFLITAAILGGCATPIVRDDAIPKLYSNPEKSIALAVLEARPYVIRGNKTPKYEGVMRAAFGIPYQIDRPKRPDDERFVDLLAGIIKDGLTDAGVKVELIAMPVGASLDDTWKKMAETTARRFVVIRVLESSWDCCGFSGFISYKYDFGIHVLRAGDDRPTAKQFYATEANRASEKRYSLFDMHSERYKAIIESMFADPVIRHALQTSEGDGSSSASLQTQPAVKTTEEKLRELKRLNDAGLISKEVYLEQQRGILSKP